jgi:hypothetical protein
MTMQEFCLAQLRATGGSPVKPTSAFRPGIPGAFFAPPETKSRRGWASRKDAQPRRLTRQRASRHGQAALHLVIRFGAHAFACAPLRPHSSAAGALNKPILNISPRSRCRSGTLRRDQPLQTGVPGRWPQGQRPWWRKSANSACNRSSSRNPRGRRISCRTPSLLGLANPYPGWRRPRCLACGKIRSVAARVGSVRAPY